MLKPAHYLDNILYSQNCFALFMFLNEYTLYLKGQTIIGGCHLRHVDG